MKINIGTINTRQLEQRVRKKMPPPPRIHASIKQYSRNQFKKYER